MTFSLTLDRCHSNVPSPANLDTSAHCMSGNSQISRHPYSHFHSYNKRHVNGHVDDEHRCAIDSGRSLLIMVQLHIDQHSCPELGDLG